MANGVIVYWWKREEMDLRGQGQCTNMHTHTYTHTPSWLDEEYTMVKEEVPEHTHQTLFVRCVDG